MADKYVMMAPQITNVINGQNVTTLGVPQPELMPLADASVAAFQAPSGAAPTQAEFNALLTKLINAGLMAPS